MPAPDQDPADEPQAPQAPRDPEPAPGGVAAGHLALLGVQGVFGLFPVLGLVAMQAERGFHPFAVAAWRIAGGALIVGLLARVLTGGLALRRGDLGRLVACALLGIVANQGLYLSGLERSSATHAGLMMCTIPVFTFAVAALAGQERFSWSRAAGVALALAGLLPLLLEGVAGGGGWELGRYALGDALMAANCLCYSVYLVLLKPLRTRYPALVLLAWNYLLSLPFLPLFLWDHGWSPSAPGDAAVWLSLTYVVLGPTVLGYLLNVFALGRVRASTTAVYVYVQPVISALGGWYFLGESLRPRLAYAAVGLFLGIWLVARRPPRGVAGEGRARPLGGGG